MYIGLVISTLHVTHVPPLLVPPRQNYIKKLLFSGIEWHLLTTEVLPHYRSFLVDTLQFNCIEPWFLRPSIYFVFVEFSKQNDCRHLILNQMYINVPDNEEHQSVEYIHLMFFRLFKDSVVNTKLEELTLVLKQDPWIKPIRTFCAMIIKQAPNLDKITIIFDLSQRSK